MHEDAVSLKRRISTRPLRRPNWPAESNSRCVSRRSVSLGFALDHSCNRPWTEVAIRLGRRLDHIVQRFGLEPAGSSALVPLGGLHTSPMKVAQSYATLLNKGAIPQVRFFSAAIGAKGNVVGKPYIREKRRAMSPATAMAVLQDLRGPVKRGTARAANSVHALVYGKTGTSSHNRDAVFVGLTQDFVGSLWLGYDRPSPMPGIHGGGAPAKAFAKLTDFYYVRAAQARFVSEQNAARSGQTWRKLAPKEQTVAKLTLIGSMLLSGLFLAALLRGSALISRPLNGRQVADAVPEVDKVGICLTSYAVVSERGQLAEGCRAPLAARVPNQHQAPLVDKSVEDIDFGRLGQADLV
jgi:penicillin-binding protein 1A